MPSGPGWRSHRRFGPHGSASAGHAHDDDYGAQNPSSSASGTWQFLDSTWNGYDDYDGAPPLPSVQDAKTRTYMNDSGFSVWKCSRACWSSSGTGAVTPMGRVLPAGIGGLRQDR